VWWLRRWREGVTRASYLEKTHDFENAAIRSSRIKNETERQANAVEEKKWETEGVIITWLGESYADFDIASNSNPECTDPCYSDSG